VRLVEGGQSAPDVARALGVPPQTVGWWVEVSRASGFAVDGRRQVVFQSDVRDGALLRVERGESVLDIARDLGIPRQTVYGWIKWHRTGAAKRRWEREQLKREVVKRIKSGWVAIDAARDLGIPHQTVYDWIHGRTRAARSGGGQRPQKYTAKFKRAAVLRADGGEPVARIARELGVVRKSLQNWIKAQRAGDVAELEKSRARYTPPFKREAVRLVSGGQSVAEVARGMGVSYHRVRDWVRAGGAPASRGDRQEKV
jgi:transposase-like protein